MAKLYFKYGAMGSSKTAQALITKYNYEENDLSVWLIKPSADTRDGRTILRSRIGLEAEVEIIPPETDVMELFRTTRQGKCDVIIVDECQFLTEAQIDQLRGIVNEYNLPVMCFGLRTDFQTRLFPGSRRLMDQNHLRLRCQGHRQRPDRQRRTHRDPGRSGGPGRQRQLHCHVPQMLYGRNPGKPDHPPPRTTIRRELSWKFLKFWQNATTPC